MGADFDAQDAGNFWFHVATTGSYQLEVEDGEVRTLAAGDLALVPHGEGHVLRSEPGAPAPGRSSTSTGR